MGGGSSRHVKKNKQSRVKRHGGGKRRVVKGHKHSGRSRVVHTSAPMSFQAPIPTPVGDIADTYKIVNKIGAGSFGRVYVVECLEDGDLWALKEYDVIEADPEDILKEFAILQLFEHPNIIEYIEVLKTKNGKPGIVMELANSGDLRTKIVDQRNSGYLFSEAVVVDFIAQIAFGLEQIHSASVFH